jgi:hypothetical protein
VGDGDAQQPKVRASRDSGFHTLTPKSGLRTRFFAFLTLFGLAFVFCYAAIVAYQAMRDSFVAPIILSPDNDLILANKLKLGELDVERARSVAEQEGVDADLAAADDAIGRLRGLHATASNGTAWTSRITSQKATASGAELTTLGEQRRVLTSMLQQQKELTSKARADRDAHIVSGADYEKEEQALHQLELALLENERSTLNVQSALGETMLAQQALAQGNNARVVMPELLVRQEGVIRLEVEVVRLESEKRSKLALKRALSERIAKIDELAAQLKGRPLFRAVDHSLDVAFVPYTQIEGVDSGSRVYSCVWGLFLCKAVGTVAELVPGEVVLPDPWGNQARGQYAVLNLADREAAKAKTLRVRPAEAARPATDAPGRVSER